jgi:hypothetical protein
MELDEKMKAIEKGIGCYFNHVGMLKEHYIKSLECVSEDVSLSEIEFNFLDMDSMRIYSKLEIDCQEFNLEISYSLDGNRIYDGTTVNIDIGLYLFDPKCQGEFSMGMLHLALKEINKASQSFDFKTMCEDLIILAKYDLI